VSARRPVLLAALLFATLAPAAYAQNRTQVLIVVGLGGTAEYRAQFNLEATSLYTALTQRYALPPEDVVLLSEKVELAPELISGRSTRANVLKALGEIAQRAGPSDRLLVVLIGHGTSDASRGSEARFNLPGPDLTPTDFQLGLTALPTQSLALIHTGSASGGFLAPLSGPNRIIITATKTRREQNATEFGRYFVEGLTGDAADLDKDGRVSLLEAFAYARGEVARFYQDENELLTEHAVLDDNGDGKGSYDAGPDGPDGPLAAAFTFGTGRTAATTRPDDPALARLYEQREEIQGRIDELRAIRDRLGEDEYLDRMEVLLVELALKNREIRAVEGGRA
jgi:hypothetical protein